MQKQQQFSPFKSKSIIRVDGIYQLPNEVIIGYKVEQGVIAVGDVVRVKRGFQYTGFATIMELRRYSRSITDTSEGNSGSVKLTGNVKLEVEDTLEITK